jgi:hypothetical protein
MFRDTLGVDFPANMADLFKAVEVRHDLVNRNGRKEGGTEHVLSADDIGKLIKAANAFVDWIESQQHKLRQWMKAEKKLLAIVAGIIVARHLDTADDLFGGPQGGPRTDSMVAAAVQWAERIMRKIVRFWSGSLAVVRCTAWARHRISHALLSSPWVPHHLYRGAEIEGPKFEMLR